MAFSSDVRQNIVLALESQGGDALTTLAAQLKKLQDLQASYDDQYKQSVITADEYVNATQRVANAMAKNQAVTRQAIDGGTEWLELQRRLGEMERATADATVAAQRATAQARDQGAQSIRDFVAASVAESGVNEQKVRATKEQIQGLKELGFLQNQVNTATAKVTNAFGGFATQAEEAADKSKKMGYAMMNFSYLAQDAQYGMGALANNIGLVSMSIGNAIPKFASATAIVGGPAGVGAILMGLGVAAQLAYQNWDLLAGLFGAGLPPKLIDDVKEAEEQLKDLTDKTWKTSIDFVDMNNLNEELRKRNELESTYQRLKSGKTEAQKKRSDVVSEAIIESGGVQGIAHTVAGLTRPTPSTETEKLETQVNELDSRIAAAKRGDTVAGLYDRNVYTVRGLDKQRKRIAKQLEDSRSTDTQNRDQGANDLVAAAANGDEGARAKLQSMLGANEGLFANRGIDVSRLGAGLEGAAPANLFADERAKHEEEVKQKDRLAQDRLAKAEMDAKVIAEKAADKAKKDKEDQDERVRVAEADAAEGARDVDHWAEQRKNKAGREQAAADRKAAAAARADQGRQDVQANRIDDGINPQLQNLFAGNRLDQTQGGGVPERTLKNALTGEVQQFLKANGQDPRLANEIVAKAFQDMSRQFLQNQSMTNDAVQSLVALMGRNNETAQRQGQGISQSLSKINMMGIQQRRGGTNGGSGQLNFSGGG